jgi:hypothetical protein
VGAVTVGKLLVWHEQVQPLPFQTHSARRPAMGVIRPLLPSTVR